MNAKDNSINMDNKPPVARRKAATAMDVAKLAGVSRSLVSRLLMNSPNLRLTEATRRRVLEAAAQLNYHPNQTARSLRQGRSNTLGVITGGFAGDMQSSIRLEDQMNEAEKFGYSILIGLTHFNHEQEWQTLMKMATRGVDGIIHELSVPRKPEHLAILRNLPIPVIFTNDCRDLDLPCVLFDNSQGLKEAMADFASNGIRRVLYIPLGPGSYGDTAIPDGMTLTVMNWPFNPLHAREKLEEVSRGDYDIIICQPRIVKIIHEGIPELKARFVFYINGPGIALPPNVYGFIERPMSLLNQTLIRRLTEAIEHKETSREPFTMLPTHFTRCESPYDIPWFREMVRKLQQEYDSFD